MSSLCAREEEVRRFIVAIALGCAAGRQLSWDLMVLRDRVDRHTGVTGGLPSAVSRPEAHCEDLSPERNGPDILQRHTAVGLLLNPLTVEPEHRHHLHHQIRV